VSWRVSSWLPAGFVSSVALTIPSLGTQSYNTWMGDPIRALQARSIISYIKTHSLLTHTSSIGSHLYTSLTTLSKTSPGAIQNLRGEGEGTFIAFDCETPAMRDRFVALMRDKGVNMGGCGEKAVRLRPMLVFGSKHAGIFLDKVEHVLGEL
jgi:4-aminobutyrate aminotransferase/(S)-3-amino-2-methylpropionate transaminase